MHTLDIHSHFKQSLEEISPLSILARSENIKIKKMAAVTTQASVAILRPCASKTRFLTGSSGKLNREVSVRPAVSSYSSFKVEAKKGEWLPGLPSPDYLNGRSVHHDQITH